MIRMSRMVILAAAPLLAAALWMDNQPSYKPYEQPVVVPPAGSVPVSGGERGAQSGNPVKPGPESLAQGQRLFDINCALCHGRTSARPGPVGSKLKPPPPGLDHGMVKGLSDSAIFSAITFGFGRMPSFRDKLTPLERWTLVTFLRTRN